MATWQNVRYGMRLLAKNPGFSVVAILVLALGIGANTAIFGTIDAALLKPLPFPHPERLVLARRSIDGQLMMWNSAPDYYDYRAEATQFESLGALWSASMKLAVKGGTRPEYVPYSIASRELFHALAVAPIAGRWFTPEEAVAGAPVAVLISERFAKRRFGSPAAAVGRTLALGPGLIMGRGAPSEVPATIVGVMPGSFRLVWDVDLWGPQRRGENDGPVTRQFHNWILVGRLRAGASLEGAQSQVDVIARRLQQEYPKSNANKWLHLDPLQNGLFESRTPLLMMLMGAAGLVLLIACANVAGLLIARGSARSGELALRVALGASRRQLAGQLLSESLLLALISGAAGIVLAIWLERLLPIATGLAGLGVTDVGLRWTVLLFALALSILSGLLFGLAPAVRASSPGVAGQLGSVRTTTKKSGTRFRGALVVGQVALSMILLTGASLLIRSLTRLMSIDPGFDMHNVLTGMIEVPYSNPERRIQVLDQLRVQMAAIPGVTAVGFTSNLPVAHPYGDLPMWAEHNPPTDPSQIETADFRRVLPGYLEALRIPLLAGRDLAASDRGTGAGVLVINQSMAQRLFPGRSPLGRRVVVEMDPKPRSFEVVGVVGDARIDAIQRPAPMTMYAPYYQFTSTRLYFMIRTKLPPQTLVETVRRVVAAQDPGIPVESLESLDRLIGDSLTARRVSAITVALFSVTAMLLACIGLYGVLAYSVSQRTNEFGIRIALGAGPRAVPGLVLRQGLLLAVTGIGLGVTGSLGLTRYITGMLFEVRPDPWNLAGTSLGLLVVTMLASYVPALRATKVDPVVALRHQ